MSNKKVFDRISKVANSNALAYYKQFSIDMTTTFARYTPVETGRATGNWILKPKVPNLSPVKVFDRSNTASTVRDNATRASMGMSLDSDTYISNAVQGEDENGSFNGDGYIIKLENRKSPQAPAGMFLINIAKSKLISKQALKKVFR